MAMTLITTNTSDDSATSSFTSSIDSTYKLYIFKFIDVSPRTDASNLQFNCSTDGGSNYNMTKTTTFFEAYHREDDSSTANVAYDSSHDLSNSVSGQPISTNLEHRPSSTVSGELWLFGPSSNFTTFWPSIKIIISCFIRN